MRRPAKITVVQMDSDADDPAENLRYMAERVDANAESDLIVFPELALHGHEVTLGHENEVRRVLKGVSDEEIASFHKHVAEANARVIYGTIVERGGRLFNLATFTDGVKSASYAKTHVHWTEPFAPGEHFPVFDTPVGPVGALICFDAAFPEVPRALAIRGARIIVNISAIPEHFPLRIVHRRVVAASVENQVFSIFANRTGDGFLGGSCIIDPRGDTVAMADDKQPVLQAEIDLADVDAWRNEEPLFPNRRPTLYGSIGQQ